MHNSTRISLAILGLLALTPAAHAELIYGITDVSGAGGNLVSFDSAAPNVQTSVGTLTGQVGGQTIRAIDFRPTNGQLYAVSATGTSAQLYTVNLSTAALTPVGSGFTLGTDPGSRLSMAFNPVSDSLTLVGGFGTNARINPVTGALTSNDPDTIYDASTGFDPAADFPFVADAAYSNKVAGASQTTLYVYDYSTDQIFTQGSVNGSPVSPTSGTLFDPPGGPNPTGIITNTASLGFDISGRTGIGYINADGADATSNDRLYTVDLNTGILTEAGSFANNMLDISVAPVPSPSSLAVVLMGAVPVGVALRRRKK